MSSVNPDTPLPPLSTSLFFDGNKSSLLEGCAVFPRETVQTHSDMIQFQQHLGAFIAVQLSGPLKNISLQNARSNRTSIVALRCQIGF